MVAYFRGAYYRIFAIFVIISLIFAVAPAGAVIYELEHDVNGNVIREHNYYYEYNSQNQLVEVRYGGVNGDLVSEYVYGPDGDRILKISYADDGTPTKTYYVSDDFIRENDGNSSVDTVYYHDAQGKVASEDSNGVERYYHLDHLGSSDVITDDGGVVVEELEYLPFGANINESAEIFTFTGQENDGETDLMYYGARYYSPFLRQFTQADTLLPDVYDPQQLNRYSYARNNPQKYIDPSGHALDIFLDIGFIVWDVVEIAKDPLNVDNWAALGLDAVGAVVPFATGLGMGYKAAKGANKVAKASRAANKAANAADSLRGIDKANDARKTVGKSADAIKWADPKDLKPVHGMNRKKPKFDKDSHENVRDLRDSMKKKGYNEAFPIEVVTAKDGRMIISQGHHRTRAAIAADLKKVPVVEAMPWNYPKYEKSKKILAKEEVIEHAKKFSEWLGRKW